MKCQYFSCEHNSIHDSSRPKGYCSIPESVEINKYRECNAYEFCGDVPLDGDETP